MKMENKTEEELYFSEWESTGIIEKGECGYEVK